MKKLLPVVALLCCLFTSCDNGVYDASPTVDKSHIANPLNPGPHYGNIGVMYGDINEAHWDAKYGYMDLLNGSLVVVGSYYPGDSTSLQQITLTLINYQGAGTYALNTEGTATWFIDSTTTTSTFGKIQIDSDANGIIRGTFSFEGPDVVVKNGFFKYIKN